MISISRREFVRLVRRAYDQAYRRAPQRMQAALDEIDVVVEDWPSDEDSEYLDGDPGSLLGLYTGVPLPEREGGPGASGFPERIAIYRQPILRRCATRAETVREIRITLLHELGHYLGMGEEDLDRLGYG